MNLQELKDRSSTRLSYDQCAFAQQVQDMTSPLKYRINLNPFENAGRCATPGDINNWANVAPRTDLESALRGIPSYRYNSQCVNMQSVPVCNDGSCANNFALNTPPILCDREFINLRQPNKVPAVVYADQQPAK